MTDGWDLTGPVQTITFYESTVPDPGPRYDVRTYDTELIYDGIAYPVTVTERSDGSVHIRSHGLVPAPKEQKP